MCGVVGWVDFARDLRREGAVLRAMTATMSLRGPDAEGVWLDEHAGLGHRRLAVIDLSTGAQPMTVEHDGAAIAVITYSGEVYNYRELRTQLRGLGHEFRTESDTEVVLHAYLEWGENFAEHLNGMYAFGLWDPREQALLLVRDRMGIKPLYYRPMPDGVVFASEPKGVLAHPQVPAVVDTDGLRELLAFTKTPGHGIYRDLREVRPGEIIRVDRSGLRARRYWSLTPGSTPTIGTPPYGPCASCSTTSFSGSSSPTCRSACCSPVASTRRRSPHWPLAPSRRRVPGRCARSLSTSPGRPSTSSRPGCI